jgi:hypothetical protein
MKYSQLTGVLYLMGFVVYAPGFALVTSVINIPDFLSSILVHKTLCPLEL